MMKILNETLIFPVLALCLAIALAVEQSPIWWIGALVILLWLLLDGPRMLTFLVEVLHKDAMLSSPHVSDCGFTVLNEKRGIAVVRDNDTGKKYWWCASAPVDSLEHIAYILYYPKSRVIVEAIPIEALTDDPLIQAVFLCRKKEALRLAANGDVAARDASGRTALHWAYRKHVQQVIPALLQRGGAEDCADRFGLTPEELRRDHAIPEHSDQFPREWLDKRSIFLSTRKGLLH